MYNGEKSDVDKLKQAASTGASKPDAVLEVDPAKMRRFMQEVRDNQNLGMGIVGGLAAAALGAIGWAAITALTGYQIGWMAIGVGFLVGITVRKLGGGVDKTFGVVGAGCALLGCLAGNLFTFYVLISNAPNMPLTEVVSLFDWNAIIDFMIDSFNPMDVLFYGIAIYYGYKNSFRQTTPEELSKLVKTG